MDKHLVILRGVPGAGKSTFASIIANGNSDIICCADDYFMKDGEYCYDPSQLWYAHDSCRKKCAALMESESPLIVVANTNITEAEIAPYFNMGVKFGYKVFSVIIENRHGNSSVHSVPVDKVEKMRKKMSISL